MTAYNGILDLPEVEQMLHYDESWGSDKTYPHMSVAWSWAFDTPFKWTKQVASHFGGTRQGMVDLVARPHQGRRRHPHPVPPHDRHRADDPRSHGHPGADDGQRHRAEADRRREHGVHVRQGERQCASRSATRSISRWSPTARIYHDGWIACTTPPGAAVAAGHRQAAATSNEYKWELYNLADDYLAVQRPRRQVSRQAQGAAGAVPGRGGEVPRLPARQLGPPAAAHAAAERDGGANGVHLLRRECRHPGRQCAEHPEQGLHDHRRDRRSRKTARRA